MRHTEIDVFQSELSAAFNNLLECRQKAFSAVNTKAFCARITLMNKLLKGFTFNEFLQDGAATFFRETNLFVWAFNALL